MIRCLTKLINFLTIFLTVFRTAKKKKDTFTVPFLSPWYFKAWPIHNTTILPNCVWKSLRESVVLVIFLNKSQIFYHGHQMDGVVGLKLDAEFVEALFDGTQTRRRNMAVLKMCAHFILRKAPRQ